MQAISRATTRGAGAPLATQWRGRRWARWLPAGSNCKAGDAGPALLEAKKSTLDVHANYL